MCIALWHLPLTPTLVLWIGLNVISAFIELWANVVSKLNFWITLRENLSRSAYLRLLAVLSLPLFALALVSNLFFLSSNEQVVYEFVNRIFNNTDSFAIYLMLALYCGANVSLDYNKVVKGTVEFTKMHGFSCCAKKDAATGMTKKKSN